MSRRSLVLLLALQAAGCSWSRFDDITSSAPITTLNKPDEMNAGFGLTLLPAGRGDTSLLFVGGAFGASSAATFSLGNGESPSVDARDVEYCDGAAGTCFLAAPPAALDHVSWRGEEHELCFVLGIGSTPLYGNGLVARCDDTVLFTYPIPDSYVRDSDFAIEVKQPEIVALSGDGGEEPWLVAGAPSQPIAWFYRHGAIEPVSLEAPGDPPPSYGKVVGALAAPDGRRLLTVAAPDQDGLFLFRATADSVQYVGCLGGTTGFGRALASGVVLGDDQVPDLVVSDRRSVYVFDGASLLDLPATTGNVCSLAALPQGGLISSFGCGSTDDISGCDAADFGAAVGVGDLDGDGDGEVAVGAPGMTVREAASAGTVLIWDLEERGETTFSEAKFMSSAEADDRLGSTLALPRVGERQIVAAGAPGNGKVALFYCSSLLPAGLRGERCK